jgi:NADH-quinone oxidoreductase subunit E
MSAIVGTIGKNTFIAAKNLGQSNLEIPAEFKTRLETIIAKYPSKKSAIMPALYLAQEYLGWVSKEAIVWVSQGLGLAPAHVESVATFYTMYYKRPVGKYHVQICRTLSCMLCGAKNLSAYLNKRLGVSASELSKDGIWSWEEVECLGSCGTAPMVQINDVFFENLTPESLGLLMDRIQKEMPDLRYSTLSGTLGQGMNDLPRSQVLGQ